MQAADLLHRASRDELAAAGWYVGGDGLPSKHGNAAGPGTPEGFVWNPIPNCRVIVRASDPCGQGGVYRTPAQRAAYVAAAKAIRARWTESIEGQREAGLTAIRARARKLGCARRA
jgi:hypothetical protein